jgi:hypothetical protein
MLMKLFIVSKVPFLTLFSFRKLWQLKIILIY